MKKIVSLFIIFLFLFNLVPYVFAAENVSVDINSFDDFSIEQIQKTFSGSLSCEKLSETKTECGTDNFLFFCKTDVVVTNGMSVNLKQPATYFFCYEFDVYGLNNLYKCPLVEKQNLIEGISEYKIKQNAYMAIALFDTVSFVNIL